MLKAVVGITQLGTARRPLLHDSVQAIPMDLLNFDSNLDDFELSAGLGTDDSNDPDSNEDHNADYDADLDNHDDDDHHSLRLKRRLYSLDGHGFLAIENDCAR